MSGHLVIVGMRSLLQMASDSSAVDGPLLNVFLACVPNRLSSPDGPDLYSRACGAIASTWAYASHSCGLV